MKEDRIYEIVEVCPYCDHENVWNVPLEETNRPIRTCQKCGRKILICSECDDCVSYGICDWHKNHDGSRECSRGRIEENE